MLVVSNENSGCDPLFLFPGIGVSTSIQCRDLALSAFTAFLCRNLKSMSRPFFLPIQSQPHFSVSTVSIQFSISSRDLTFLPFAEIYVVTSISCHDIIFVANYVDLCCDHVFLKLNKFCVATWLSFFLLRFVSLPQKHVVTPFLLSATDSWSQLPFSCCDLKLFVCSLSCRDMGFRLRPRFSFPC